MHISNGLPSILVLFQLGIALHKVNSHTNTQVPPRYTNGLQKNGIFQIVNQILSTGYAQNSKQPSPGQQTRKRNPKEIGGFIEGDMRIPQNFIRNGVIAEERRWPDATVVYQLDPALTPEEREKIQKAMNEISEKTCVRFRPCNSEDISFVFIEKGAKDSGCNAHVGRLGEKQVLNLEEGCFDHATIVHEMLHTLGFGHEQSRPDRDQFVEIIWDNILDGDKHNFKSDNPTEFTTFGAPYDYGSVMHYDEIAFAVDQTRHTIVPKIPGVPIGKQQNLSELDAGKIRILYKCKPQN